MILPDNNMWYDMIWYDMIWYKVGRFVGNDCTTNRDTCTDDNAGCNGTICDCNDGFLWDGMICGNEEI